MNKKLKSLGNISIWVLIYVSFICIGFVAGMFFQQEVTKRNVIDVLTYSNLELNVNINETKMVDEMRKMINESIIVKTQQAKEESQWAIWENDK